MGKKKPLYLFGVPVYLPFFLFSFSLFSSFRILSIECSFKWPQGQECLESSDFRRAKGSKQLGYIMMVQARQPMPVASRQDINEWNQQAKVEKKGAWKLLSYLCCIIPSLFPGYLCVTS
jgi:hypothetical protein